MVLHIRAQAIKFTLSHRWEWRVLICLIVATLISIYYCTDYVLPNVMIVKSFQNMFDFWMDSGDNQKLLSALKLEKERGCIMPLLDPFHRNITSLDPGFPFPIECPGKDWVKCYQSKCRLVDDLGIANVTCQFRDIIYVRNNVRQLGPWRYFNENGTYELTESDFARVFCTGLRTSEIPDEPKVSWAGNVLGLRPLVPKTSPQGEEESYNVVIFGFKSTSRNGFIRHMPKSWEVLTEELNATVLKSYSIFENTAPAALLPILTGETEYDVLDANKYKEPADILESLPFLFHKLRDVGYRTGFFEDVPEIDTFQQRFRGWRDQPTDHYLRHYFLEEADSTMWTNEDYCIRDTPRYKLMINMTEQFMDFKGKKFVVTLISDITQKNFDTIHVADDEMAKFLRFTKKYAKDTLLIIMGDHGRNPKINDTLQGKIEERLPLMALVLPTSLEQKRPGSALILKTNEMYLTTPLDVHATIIDLLEMRQLGNSYKVPGANINRALSMLQPFPKNRSCSEAGILPFWCACHIWANVPPEDPFYNRSAHALLNFINDQLMDVGDVCVPRTVTFINWVMRQQPVYGHYVFSPLDKVEGWLGVGDQYYVVNMVTGPGSILYDTWMVYYKEKNEIRIDISDVLWQGYNMKSDCLNKTFAHFKQFCYCRE